MMQQFQSVLKSPRAHLSNDQTIKKTQDALLNALEEMFPAQYDFQQLAQIYQIKQVSQSPIILTYHIVNYFIKVIGENFVSIHSYASLQEQTQKLQMTIRSHIKLQQEVKMYLEHLETKISKYENYIQHSLNREKKIRQSMEEQKPPNNEVTMLMKERIQLIQKVQSLTRKLAEKQSQMKRFMDFGHDKMEIVQNFMEKDKLILSKSQKKLESEPNDSIRKPQNTIAKIRTPRQNPLQSQFNILINGNGTNGIFQNQNGLIQVNN